MRAGGGSKNPTAPTATAPTLGETWLKQQRQIIASSNGRESGGTYPPKRIRGGGEKNHSLVLTFIQAFGR